MRVRYPNVRVRMTEVPLTPSSILDAYAAPSSRVESARRR